MKDLIKIAEEQIEILEKEQSICYESEVKRILSDEIRNWCEFVYKLNINNYK